MNNSLSFSKLKLLIFCISVLSNTALAQLPSIQWQQLCDAYAGGMAIKQTPDGGYIIVGGTQDGSIPHFHAGSGGDALVVRLDSNGNTLWTKVYGGSDNDLAFDVIETFDGNHLITVSTGSNDGDVTFNHGNGDIWLIKINDTGGIIWQKTYGGSSIENWPRGQQTTDSSFIISCVSTSIDGDITSVHGGQDIWIFKVSNSGSLIWQKNYGGSSIDYPGDIRQTFDGGYIFTGTTASNDGQVSGNHGLYDCWVCKIDDTGMLVWQKTLGGTFSDFSEDCIRQTSDSGYILIGTTGSNDGDVIGFHGMPDTTGDIWVVKLTSIGSLAWQKTYGGTRNEVGKSIMEVSGNKYVLTGYTISSDGDIIGHHGAEDGWIAKIDSIGTIIASRTIGGANTDEFNSIVFTQDGGYVVIGFTESNDGDVVDTSANYYVTHAWVVKFGIDSTLIPLNNENNLQKSEMKIYPSPTTGILKVELPLKYNYARLHVLNLLGQEIEFKEQSATIVKTIYLQNIPSGMYILKVIGENINETYTFFYMK